nr:hypothetical protein Iba_chr05dCG18090 [Ipomoea batatas]GMD02339.1 hypothetical protein Iba_chr05fCG15670 [Ipomoea batatas]
MKDFPLGLVIDNRVIFQPVGSTDKFVQSNALILLSEALISSRSASFTSSVLSWLTRCPP